MKSAHPILLFICLVIIYSCNKNSESPLQNYDLKGTVQKGPFSNGSELAVYELDSKLVPTGRTFHSTIMDLGNFEINGISLISPYAELVATGFYFNEISGELSSSQLTLRAIVDLTDKENVNLNLLTNLEYERVKYLVSNNELEFAEAKLQAENEILKVFNLEEHSISNSELLNISQTGDDDAVLLAISTIILGNNSPSKMSKIVSDMVTDMKLDGVLDNTEIQNTLFSQALLLNFELIKENIKENYLEFGITLDQINNFDEKVRHFIENSSYKNKSPFEFPDSTDWGRNILSTRFYKFEPNKTCTMAVEMPETGKIKVKISIIEGTGHFYRLGLQGNGWDDHIYNDKERSCIYSSNLNGTLIEDPFSFEGYCKAKIEVFFNDNTLPAIIKFITWGGYNNSDFEFPDDPFNGINLLAMNDSTVLQSDSIYKIEFVDWNTVTDSLDITFTFTFPSTATIAIVDGWNYQMELTDNNLKIYFTGSNGWLVRLKMNGEGVINLSSDLLFKDDTFLKRIFLLKK